MFSRKDIGIPGTSPNVSASSSLLSRSLCLLGASLMTQRVKNPPAVQETWVLSLGWENPLEKEMATHSSILSWKIPWTEETGGV